MSERITDKRIEEALAALTRALEAHGWRLPEGHRLVLAAPYGQVMYVVRATADYTYEHDVPGFVGSGGSGFTSKRDAYEAITRTTRVLGDLTYGSAPWA